MVGGGTQPGCFKTYCNHLFFYYFHSSVGKISTVVYTRRVMKVIISGMTPTPTLNTFFFSQHCTLCKKLLLGFKSDQDKTLHIGSGDTNDQKLSKEFC